MNCFNSYSTCFWFDLPSIDLCSRVHCTTCNRGVGGEDATCWHSKNRSSYWSCMFSSTATKTHEGVVVPQDSSLLLYDRIPSTTAFTAKLLLLQLYSISTKHHWFYWAFCSFNLFFYMWFLLRYLLYFIALFCCIKHSIVYYFCCCNRAIHQSVNQIKCSHPSATTVTFKCLYHCSAFNLQYKAPWGNGCYDLLLYK